ncbi:MAG: hypothetical protein M4579_002380 [Chaenotheca gracillima]|nr:MAG: hypothetical protein M4579_002380 [Chaenotheca gracillima]
MGSRKRSRDHQDAIYQHPVASPKTPRTSNSSRPLGLMISRDQSAQPASASPAFPSFHVPETYRTYDMNGSSAHRPHPSSVSLAPSNMSDQYGNDTYMSDVRDSRPHRLLNEHEPFILQRAYGHRPHHLPAHTSVNQNDLHEFMTYKEFTKMADEYVNGLSERKRDKALLPAWRCANIRQVLKDPKATTVETAQFRIPKELIARFVANCPKCEARRNIKNNASSQRRPSPISSSPAGLDSALNHVASLSNGSAPENVGYHSAMSTSVSAANAAAVAASQNVPQYIPSGYPFAQQMFAPSGYPVVSQEPYLGNGAFAPSNAFGGYN